MTSKKRKIRTITTYNVGDEIDICGDKYIIVKKEQYENATNNYKYFVLCKNCYSVFGNASISNIINRINSRRVKFGCDDYHNYHDFRIRIKNKLFVKNDYVEKRNILIERYKYGKRYGLLCKEWTSNFDKYINDIDLYIKNKFNIDLISLKSNQLRIIRKDTSKKLSLDNIEIIICNSNTNLKEG